MKNILQISNPIQDRCIFCGDNGTEVASTDFIIYFSEFKYSTGSICKSCYNANTKRTPGYPVPKSQKF